MAEVLTEDVRGKVAAGNHKKDIKDLSDLVLIHKTNYIPTDGIIKSSKDAGVLAEGNFWVGEQEYKVSFPSERESVHFAVNGEVESHIMGDFDNRKYAIIIPFNLMDTAEIVGGSPVDTFTKGSIAVPKGSYILCPESEVTKVKGFIKNIQVIGYEGQTVNGYANYLINQVLGYKKEKIGDWSWENANKDSEKFSEIFKELGLTQTSHSLSKENDISVAKMSIHKMCQIIKLIKNSDIIKNEVDYSDGMVAIKKTLTAGSMLNGHRSIDTIFRDVNLIRQLYVELEEAEIQIPDETKEYFKQLQTDAEEKDRQEDKRVGMVGNLIFRQEANDLIADTIAHAVLDPYREKYILAKTFEQLNDDEKDFFKHKLQEITINTGNGYKIFIPTNKMKWTENGFIEQECLEKTAPIISYDHDEDKELLDKVDQSTHFEEVVEGNIETNFKAIQSKETLGEYITRMRNSIGAIERFINGENIRFNEDGTERQERKSELSESEIEIVDGTMEFQEIDIGKATLDTPTEQKDKAKNQMKKDEQILQQAQENQEQL